MYFLIFIILVQFTDATPDRIVTDLYCTGSFIQNFEAHLFECFGLQMICIAQYCLFTKSRIIILRSTINDMVWAVVK